MWTVTLVCEGCGSKATGMSRHLRTAAANCSRSPEAQGMELTELGWRCGLCRLGFYDEDLTPKKPKDQTS